VFGAESLADEVSGQIPQRREQPEEPKGSGGCSEGSWCGFLGCRPLIVRA
jgi:hypothetical protein